MEGGGGNMGEVRRPHGGGWGEHGGSSPEKCPTRGAIYSDLVKSPPMPHPAPGGGGGGGGVSLIGA